jgi:selenocysteine lyase/cysteine desulfurase
VDGTGTGQERALDANSLPARCRQRFPILERLVYVNSCSQGALSDAVRAAYAAYLADWDEHGAPWEYWVGRSEAARDAFAGLVNAERDEVAVTTSVSAGVSALAGGLELAKRPKVVVSNLEFPTIGQIWHAQEPRGAQIVHAPEGPDGLVPLETLDELVDEETLLVSIAHVCYRTGARSDVEAVVELAHERGALVLLDAYQTLGSLPVDVRALGVDVLAGGALKYLLASAGLGFLWCRRDLVESIFPTATGWWADRDIFEMDIFDYSPTDTARRFESGTPPIPSIYAGIAGIELMREIGIAETATHVHALGERLIAGVEALGGRIATPAQRGALVCVASTDEQALVAALAAEGIVTSSRNGNLRVSPHCYNTVEDVDAVLDALSRHRALLA